MSSLASRTDVRNQEHVIVFHLSCQHLALLLELHDLGFGGSANRIVRGLVKLHSVRVRHVVVKMVEIQIPVRVGRNLGVGKTLRVRQILLEGGNLAWVANKDLG